MFKKRRIKRLKMYLSEIENLGILLEFYESINYGDIGKLAEDIINLRIKADKMMIKYNLKID